MLQFLEFFKTKILQQGLSTAFVSDTRRGSHKMLYLHFEVMKSVRGRSLDVEPLLFGTDSIVEDFALLIKE